MGNSQREQQLLDSFSALNLKNLSELNRFPKYLQIETTSLCNARCVMCPIEEWTRAVNMMQPELFNKILEELKGQVDWVEKVTIQLDGEPLIDKNLEDKITRLKEIGIKCVAFASNASLMTKERGESLMRAGIDEVSFSIDGATAETFEAIRRRLKYDQCIKNIEDFIATRDELNASTVVRIRMTVQKANAHEFEDFMAFWNERLGTQDSAYGKLIHNWANWLADYSLPGGQDKQTLNDQACQSLWSSLVVLTDGRVSLCCSDYDAFTLMGDINNSTIQEVWQDEEFEKARQAHLGMGRNSMKFCKDCNVWDCSSKVTSLNDREQVDSLVEK